MSKKPDAGTYTTQDELLLRAKYIKSSQEYRSHRDYPDIVASALARGFRPITLNEQMSRGVDAYTWRGGVWVQLEEG